MSEWYRMKNGCATKHNSSINNLSSETSVDTSCCEISDSFINFSDNLSPIPAIVPRKLDFSNVDDDDGMRNASPAPAPMSPPYKRVRALRLFDSPHTPKTLLEKSSTPSHQLSRSRLFPPKLATITGIPSGSSHHLHPPNDDSALGSLPPDDDHNDNNDSMRMPVITINPFTPDGQALNKKKRSLSKTSKYGDTTPEHPAKRLRESNISRYKVEFIDLGVIGSGEFGVVSKCMNKLDGCVYGVKRSRKPLGGSAAKAALTEVYAHAALGRHEHVVRYYSAWAEDDHMIIQNEYCDGGSLQQRIERDGPLPEKELLLLLQHVADGLAYIHKHNLVHMDVKPANIFICGQPETLTSDDDDDGFDDDELPSPKITLKYKIGDLGHVTCLSSPHVEEGDCRYLPKEVLQEDFSDLTKADVFAFGLTLYEAAGGGPLPKNGQEWHDIRDGRLPDLPNLSRELNELLKNMVHPIASRRPAARQLSRAAVRRHDCARLRRQLAAAQHRTALLERELHHANRHIKALTPSIVDTESAKFKTRLAKRNLQNSQLAEMVQSVPSLPRRNRATRQKRL